MYQTAKYSSAGGRSYNEDSIGIVGSPKGSVCMVVADGLGGHGGGDEASRQVCATVTEGWDGQASGEQLRQLLLQAHEQICRMQTQKCAMKSTAAVLAVRGPKAAWAHVGDTRLYHFLNGKLVYRTIDHSASQLAVTLGQITSDQIRFHEDRSRLLRALGMDGNLTVDVKEEILEEGHHAFLMCSDGFWEYVCEKEMEEDLWSASKPAEWLKAMQNRLMQRVKGENDNHSAAVMWLNWKNAESEET